jgi:hypothetical protein
VLSAVELHDEPCFKAGEIDEVSVDRNLATELEAVQSAAASPVDQLPLASSPLTVPVIVTAASLNEKASVMVPEALSNEPDEIEVLPTMEEMEPLTLPSAAKSGLRAWRIAISSRASRSRWR